MHQFAATEVELFNGSPFDPTDPRASAIDLNSVAQALSCICRYGGHVEFMSVAEHAVMVSVKLRRIGASLSLQFAGLHHDNHEALDGFGDIQSPAKSLLPPDYHTRVAAIDQAVWQALGWLPDGSPSLWTVEELHDPTVKRVDLWCKRFEAKRLMKSAGAGWLSDDENGTSMPPIPDDPEDCIKCLPPEWAKLEFIELHEALVREHEGLYG